jgi:hypothetical protein
MRRNVVRPALRVKEFRGKGLSIYQFRISFSEDRRQPSGDRNAGEEYGKRSIVALPFLPSECRQKDRQQHHQKDLTARHVIASVGL